MDISNKYVRQLYLNLKNAMTNKSINTAQRKTTLKWNSNGELSSIDMARIINSLSIKELKECKLTCSRVSRNKKNINLGMWW